MRDHVLRYARSFGIEDMGTQGMVGCQPYDVLEEFAVSCGAQKR